MANAAFIFLQQAVVVVVAVAITTDEDFGHDAALESRFNSVNDDEVHDHCARGG